MIKKQRAPSRTRMIEEVDRHVLEALAAGTLMNRCARYEGPRLDVDGRELSNFGSCGYLALEKRDELKEGACRAAREYGTQLPFPRHYLECALYGELEDALSQMTDAQVLVGPSTMLIHMAALPVLVGDRDAVLVDQFAHASLHTATALLGETHVELVRHNRLDRLEERVSVLKETHEAVWYLCDGLYSMHGDFAPFEELRGLLERHEQLRLYVDDAHATSWFGLRGRGAGLNAFGVHDRIVVALSLNKAFCASGGALVVADARTRDRVRRCGGALLFSGPVQPPMLGAAVASAKLHLDSAFATLQGELMARIDRALQALARARVPLASQERTPIFHVECGSPRAFRTVQLLRDQGYFVCPTTFPAVPMNREGIRFTITLHQEPADIDSFANVLAVVLDRVAPEGAAAEPVSVGSAAL